MRPSCLGKRLNSGAEIVPSAGQLIDREASYVQEDPEALAILARAAMFKDAPFIETRIELLSNILDLCYLLVTIILVSMIYHHIFHQLSYAASLPIEIFHSLFYCGICRIVLRTVPVFHYNMRFYHMLRDDSKVVYDFRLLSFHM